MPEHETVNMNTRFLGIVHDGEYQLLMPERSPGDSPRFTSIQPQEAVPPESGELNLADYEGSAILIQGQVQGGWVYSAMVIDTAGPIVTAVVENVFALRSGEAENLAD